MIYSIPRIFLKIEIVMALVKDEKIITYFKIYLKNLISSFAMNIDASVIKLLFQSRRVLITFDYSC